MTLKLYNTLTRKKELFKPIKNKQVGMYTCGPTVYDYAHIGNFRAYISSDVLKRYLKYKGFRVKHIMNITDVEDKTIKGAIKEHISLKKYTKKFEKAFFEDLEKLNIDKADIFPRATDHIKEMVDIIENLLKKKIAYKAKDGIYFDISNFKDYGNLSRVELKNLEVGERVKEDQYEKEEAHDFALWKFWDKEDYDVFWETKIGKGRPGWHIECSAMSMKLLGKSFDIHAGGIDLIFPHHENEIAQSEASTNKKFVKYWFHNEHLLVDGQKMGKSLGNFYTLRDLLDKGYDSRSIRYLLLSSHYGQQLNFTEDGIKAAKNSIDRLNDFMTKLKTIKNKKNNPKVKKLILGTKINFEREMDDDLEVSNALAVIFDFVKKINTLIMEGSIGKKDADDVYNLMLRFDKIFGVLETKKEKIPDEIKKLVKEREKARKEKDYGKADKIRDEIKNKGYILEDDGEGTAIKNL
ncbi:MAG: cysteine--tRNA ligase [Candidatus Woesearchaeota archaeon]|nr:cysteine--tRNA ligase [Candidatus Woesearchaeota archaeon]